MDFSHNYRHAFFILAALALATAASAAELPYSNVPLSLPAGVQPNVALMIDTSGSMGATDTGGTGNITSVCDGVTIKAQPMTRIDAAKEAACQTVQDNANGMRIGLYRFTGGNNGLQVTPIASNTSATLKTAIAGLSATGGTPLTSAMDTIVKDYVGASSPIQYRCQKNYAVFFSDGAPTTGADQNTPYRFPSLDTQQNSLWPNSTAASNQSANSPSWDGFLDPLYNPDGSDVYPWLDDLTQFAYDVDIKTATSPAATTALCEFSMTGVVGKDCSNKSWDGTDDSDGRFAQQNIVTHTVAFGPNAKNGLMLSTPLLNQIPLVPADVYVAVDAIRLENHGLSDGQFVHYYSAAPNPMIGGLYAYETDARPDATPNPATETASRGKYYIEYVDANWFKLRQCGPTADCTTRAATPVDLTSTGSGVLSTGPGKSFFSTTAAELTVAMRAAFADILNDAAIGAINAGGVLTDTNLYQTQYHAANWSGEITAFQITQERQLIQTPPAWLASENVPTPYSNRKIFTWNGTTGVVVTSLANLTAQQVMSMGPVTAAEQQKVLDWVLGKDDPTLPGSRARTKRWNGTDINVYGDILNSNPVYVGESDQNYDNTLPTGTPGKDSYYAFKAANWARPPMLYVGANDGMLHGINANTGVENFGFIPNGVFIDWLDIADDGFNDDGEVVIRKFYELTRENYGKIPSAPHRYFVDGEQSSGDAFFTSAKAGMAANNWHTVLVGGLGRGGRSIYALDVTNPDDVNASKVLWEFSAPANGRMGYSYGKPQIARLPTGQWAAIFGNGYDGSGDLGRLYIINLETGAQIKRIDATGSNGLSSVSVLKDTTGTATAVYAGDLLGNVWKFDISNNNSAVWPSVVNAPFFTATDSNGNPQPITSAITLGPISASATCSPGQNCTMLYFGTGSYFQDSDRYYNAATATPRHDTFYALLDNGSDNIPSNKTTLVEQTLGTVVVGSKKYRTGSANAVNYQGTDRGWYMNLVEAANYRGERIVFAPTLASETVFFATVIPSGSDPCVHDTGSWLMGMTALDGNMRTVLFDTNGDGVFDTSDTPVTGKESANGLFTQPLSTTTYVQISNPDGSATFVSTADIYIGTSGTGDSSGPSLIIHEQILLNEITFPAPNSSVKNDYTNDNIAGWIWKGQSNGYETVSQIWQLTYPLLSANYGVPNRFYPPPFPDQANWDIVTTGDFNRDGDADILWRHNTLATWKVWQMQNGTRVAQNAPADFDLAHEWTVIGSGDTDRDGDDDVILNNTITGQVIIWNMEDHAIANIHSVGTKAGYKLNRIGDFDRDGAVDLLFREIGTDVLITWELEGNFFVAERALANTGTGYNPVCAGDFDNDGDDDIMLVNSATTQEKWFVMEYFARTQAFGSSNTGFVFKSCGDYDGDGDMDSLWQRSSDDANRVVLQQNYGATKQTVYTNAFGGVNPGAAGYGFVYRGNSN